MSDTSTEARRVQREALRRAGGVARLRMALDMSSFVRELALRRIRLRQPELSRAEALRLLLEPLLPADATPRGR